MSKGTFDSAIWLLLPLQYIQESNITKEVVQVPIHKIHHISGKRGGYWRIFATRV